MENIYRIFDVVEGIYNRQRLHRKEDEIRTKTGTLSHGMCKSACSVALTNCYF